MGLTPLRHFLLQGCDSLFQVFKEQRELPWPQLLAYWGLPNLQVINSEAHVAKCAAEAGYRKEARAEDVAA